MRKTLIAAAVTTMTTSFFLVTVADARNAVPASQPAIASLSIAVALDDPTIVAIFDAANTADIETGELAMQRGHLKEVRDFGAMLSRDHKMVRQQGRDLAKRLGVTPTPPTDDASGRAHTAAMSALRTMRGATFDHAFLQHEIAYHKSVIEAITTTLLPAIRNAELKDLVVKVAPAFQAHMVAAGSLDTRLFGSAVK